jgi:hypothetical protein
MSISEYRNRPVVYLSHDPEVRIGPKRRSIRNMIVRKEPEAGDCGAKNRRLVRQGQSARWNPNKTKSDGNET